jgi:putative YhdH/YhfP family quinone oxidoreductase
MRGDAQDWPPDERKPMPHQVRAVVATRVADEVEVAVEVLDEDELGPGDVVIDIAWSGVNYKDALAAARDGKVARLDRLVPGVDLAGTVVRGPAEGPPGGTEVLVHGYDLGVAHHGGFAERAVVPVEWVVPLPTGLDLRDAMILGTAGFTAGRSLDALERRGLRPGDGEVLVTGAAGGVGGAAIAMLARRGYEVVASTGKADQHDRLLSLGAAQVVDRSETSDPSRPLGRERWAGAIDCVGGSTLAWTLSTLRAGAAVAASGNAGGSTLATTVFPFILRGAALLGIDSVQVPIAERAALWQRLGADLRPVDLDALVEAEVGLAEVPNAFARVREGHARGRTVVDVRR